jgi:hypothetical protein
MRKLGTVLAFALICGSGLAFAGETTMDRARNGARDSFAAGAADATGASGGADGRVSSGRDGRASRGGGTDSRSRGPDRRGEHNR